MQLTKPEPIRVQVIPVKRRKGSRSVTFYNTTVSQVIDALRKLPGAAGEGDKQPRNGRRKAEPSAA
jgi:hypothetical protein